MTKKLLNYNGAFIEADKPIFTSENRAFKYGDAIFETLRLTNGKLPFINQHYARLEEAMEALGYEIPEEYEASYFSKKILDLTAKNGDDGNARIRITVFRKKSKSFDIKNNEAEYLIETSLLTTDKYSLNKSGLKVAPYNENLKPINPVSKFKTANYLIPVLANYYKQVNELDDCLIYNTNEELIESTTSNVFIVQDGKLITPPVSSGCVDGIMRRHILSLAKNLELKVAKSAITEADLKNADEVFLTNSINGIKWVGEINGNGYTCAMAEKLTAELNRSIGLG